jgi:hypothetical protein
MRAKELHVLIVVVKQRDDQTPRLRTFLDLKQLVLYAF